MSASLPVGSSYESLFKLAAGGMAEVWVARQRGGGRFQRPVALKRMLPHLREDEGFVAMFLDEGTLAGAISHPNVVATYDVGVDDENRPYLVMELVVGVSLSQMLRASRGEVPLALGIEVLAQACEGLHAAHVARSPTGKLLEIVHRDVSPQNILVGEDGRVRIGDFGVARALERLTQTTTGEVKGKASYFSPEQARANVPLDARSDVFSMGIVAWEVLAGRRLFGGMSPVSALAQILSPEPIADVDTVRLTVPEEIADVVATALVKNRDERFDTAAAFGTALRNAARNAGLERPEPRELSEFVEKIGGAELASLKARIAAAFEPAIDEPDTERTLASVDVEVSEVSDAPTAPSVPPSSSEPATPTTRTSHTPSAHRASDAAVVSTSTPDLVPPPPSLPREARAPRSATWIAVGLLLLLGVGLGAFFGSRSRAPGEEPVDAPSTALETPAPPTEVVVVEPPEAEAEPTPAEPEGRVEHE
ncbi:MAG: protein kinase [Polyangiales bacterium]